MKWFWIGLLVAEVFASRIYMYHLEKRLQRLEFIADAIFWGPM